MRTHLRVERTGTLLPIGPIGIRDGIAIANPLGWTNDGFPNSIVVPTVGSMPGWRAGMPVRLRAENLRLAWAGGSDAGCGDPEPRGGERRRVTGGALLEEMAGELSDPIGRVDTR